MVVKLTKRTLRLTPFQSFLLLLFLLHSSSFVFAQYDQDEPVVFENEFKTSFRTQPKLDIKLDNRFSFIRDNDVKTLGLKVGLSFNRKFKVGLGINRMVVPVQKQIRNEGVTINVKMRYYYVSPYFEYVYYSSRRWEFSLSTQVGLGSASLNYVNLKGVNRKIKKTTIWSYEPATLIDYKILRWFGIGTGVGYRLILYKTPGIQQKFSSPEYVLKLKIYLGEIVRTFTGKDLEID